jgi:voltage-gated potassium channel
MGVRFFIKKIWKMIAVFLVIFFLGSVLFYVFEFVPEDDRDDGYSGPENFPDSFWFGIVSLSTVGYGDRYPVTMEGKITSFILIVFTFTFLGAMIGQVTDTFNEARKREELGMDGVKFRDHLVLIGWCGISSITLEELLATDQKIVVMTDNKEDIPIIRDMGPRSHLQTVFGDFKAQNILERANVPDARTIIIATDDDAESLIVALTVKQMNPSARIIVTIKEQKLKKTLYSAGMTYVSTPNDLTGRMVASAAFEPEVSMFIEDITSATSGYDLQQYTITSSSFANGITVGDFHKKMSGMGGPLLVALGEYNPKEKGRKENPKNWKLIKNPPKKKKISEKDIIVVLGSEEENRKLREILGAKQGR